MKKLFGLCVILALVSSGLVLSDEVRSIVEQNTDPNAVQAVESAVEDAALPIQEEALPEEEALPQQSDVPVLTPADEIEEVAPGIVQTTPLTPNTQFILGVIASPVPPMVRAQINLPGESGLFVQTIKPNGPAAQAGVLPYDIIVSVDGIPVSNTNDLSAQIQKAAGKPQKMTVLRHGKELTLNIVAQPAELPHQSGNLMLGNPVMPTPQPFIDPLAPNYDPDDDCSDPAFPRLQNFMERQRRQMDLMRQRMEAMENAMRQGMPGFVPFTPAPAPTPAPSGTLTLPPTPATAPNVQTQSDSFSVQIQKNGNEPAIIKIQDNGNEYIVDENSVDQLPENVRNRLNFKIQTNDK